MSADHTSLLILGNCGRAMAESAARGGYEVAAFDLFCDRDTRAVADCRPVSQGFSHLDVDSFIDEMASVFPPHACGIVYGAGLEEASNLLARLSSLYRLFGNEPSVMELLCKPQRFFALLDRLGIPYPAVSITPPDAAADKRWLIKRAGSCGGLGVSHFSPEHSTVDFACYYQRHLAGRVMSMLFIADGKRHRTIGFNKLLTRSSGTSAPFLYTGAVGQVSVSEDLWQEMEPIVESLVAELGLRGINGLDFIHNDDGIFVIDLNPRPTATLELYEHLTKDGWIRRHIQACLGELPVMSIMGSPMMHGHQIVYARETMVIPLEMTWPSWVRDKPMPRSRITMGEPVCSVFTQGARVNEVEESLADRQEQILRTLGVPSTMSLPCRVAV